MWVTFQKYPRKSGWIFRKDVHTLEVWLFLTEDEKETIAASGLSYPLYDIEEDVHGKRRVINLSDFNKNSGPKTLDFSSAFEVHATAQEIKSSVENISNAIQAYDSGLITQEESYEL